MIVKHGSTATQVARGTSEEMSRKSLDGSLSVWVFCREAERRDVFGLVPSWSDSRYKRMMHYPNLEYYEKL